MRDIIAPTSVVCVGNIFLLRHWQSKSPHPPSETLSLLAFAFNFFFLFPAIVFGCYILPPCLWQSLLCVTLLSATVQTTLWAGTQRFGFIMLCHLHVKWMFSHHMLMRKRRYNLFYFILQLSKTESWAYHLIYVYCKCC